MISKPKQLLVWLSYTLGIIGLVFGVYYQAVQLTFAQDDWIFLQRLVASQSLTEKVQLFFQDDHFYRPVPRVLVLGIEYRLFGLDAMLFHCVHLLIHCLNAVLVAYLATKVTKSMLIGLVAGLLYAIHQAVYLSLVWVAGIQELMLVLGVLTTLLCYVRFIESDQRRYYLIALFTLFLSLLSKDTAIVVPIWITCLGLLLRPIQLWRKSIRDGLGCVVITAIYVFVRWWKAGVSIQQGSYKLSIDLTTFSKNTQLYVADLFAMRLREDFTLFGPFWLMLFLLICVALIWYLPQDRPVIMAGLVLFTSGIGPVILLATQNYSYYLALPLIGVVWVFALAIVRVSTWLAAKTPWMSLRWGFMFGLLLIIGYQHLQHINVRWLNDEGGIRYKALLSSEIQTQLAPHKDQLNEASILVIRNTNSDMYWAWGQGHMFKALYPNLETVYIEPNDVLPPLDSSMFIHDFATPPEFMDKVYAIRPPDPEKDSQ